MAERVEFSGVQIDPAMFRFIADELVPDSGMDEGAFWDTFSSLLERFSARNAALLALRTHMQEQIDEWHRTHSFDASEYKRFLQDIGCLESPGPTFEITTEGVDEEISVVAGPQLVVPLSNERYALNAANARWGSLYDALYGSDALGSPPPSGPYDPQRGAEVVAWARDFLDVVVPLTNGTHHSARGYVVTDEQLAIQTDDGLAQLVDASTFAGYLGDASAPASIFFRHHGLHIELVIDREHAVGISDRAGIADVVIEAAMTAIMDGEDSVAAVDAIDKVGVYRNWLRLMKGDLTAEVAKGDATFTRRLAEDRIILGPDGNPTPLRGRALMLVRNVGHHMTTNAVLDKDGNEVYEGLLDALVTVLAATHDLVRGADALNSRTGSVYVVKPKMHGSDEVTFTDDVFAFVEDVLELPRNTVKIGLMDEERRTTLNLAECIRAAAGRIAFINTGFLDRTGDEIHTSMVAGAVVRKKDMRSEEWLLAYEDHNVDVGLACGLKGRAQIGKGMWAAPDLMADMLREKISHPMAGANCAWVPSPTAATLHATHYHRVDVTQRQGLLVGQTRTTVDQLLSIPVSRKVEWSDDEIRAEVENNAQGILGYVVRWIDQGVGCSKVPDINDVALMEDRATCRISSQHIANWLYHDVVDRDMVMATMRRMAAVVDKQNAGDAAYSPMGPDFDGLAFSAACDLVFSGSTQPSGYTEPVLHAQRRRRKQMIGGDAG
jgi:malate synthase